MWPNPVNTQGISLYYYSNNLCCESSLRLDLGRLKSPSTSHYTVKLFWVCNNLMDGGVLPFYWKKLKKNLAARGMMKKMQMDNNCNLWSVCIVEGKEIYDSVPILLINFMLTSHRKDIGREVIQGVGTRDLRFPLLVEFSKCKPKSCLLFLIRPQRFYISSHSLAYFMVTPVFLCMLLHTP